MTDPTPPNALSLESVASLVSGRVSGATDVMFEGIAPVGEAGPRQFGFVAASGFLKFLGGATAGAYLIRDQLVPRLDAAVADRPMVIVEDPHTALRRILDHFHPVVPGPTGVHPSAVVEDGAEVGADCWIGAGALIERGARIGARSSVGPYAVVGAGSVVGEDTTIHGHVLLYPGVALGNRVIVHAGARIGVDGFGYVYEEGKHLKVPQVGGCVIEDDVEIGANTCIDRGSIGNTRVGAGSKIDNLVHIAHNVVIGAGSLIVAQVGVAGSSRIGRGVMLGGQVGVSGHLEIGDGARLGAQAGVIGDVPAGATFWGTPARPRGETLRRLANMGKVEDLAKRVAALEAGKVGPEGPS